MSKSASQDELLVGRPKLVSVQEAADVLDVSASHLYDVFAEAAKNGVEVAGLVRVGRAIRLDLDTFIEHGGLS